MAYMCIMNPTSECYGCGFCAHKQSGVEVEAILKISFTAYGDIEEDLRQGYEYSARDIAEMLIEENISFEDLDVDVSIKDIRCELVEE